MELMSVVEKRAIYRLFGISGGYIFDYWTKQGKYNKNTTRQIIKEACGIDIYTDHPYNTLSQQKCVEKIWDDGNPQMVANLLSVMSDYFEYEMGSYFWSDDDQIDYRLVKGVIERLRSTPSISLPEQDTTDLKLILGDIEANVQAGKPELVIDRLHTLATQYIRKTCISHDISIVDERGDYYSLDSLAGKLKKWYEQENYFESDFCILAIRNTIGIFVKYNELRNNFSAAHPNPLLQSIEAEYAVKVVSDTLMFIDRIEKSKEKERMPWDYGLPNADWNGVIPF